jgi:crooked neck
VSAAAAEAAEGEEAAEARESAARSVFERALRRLRATQPDAKEEAVMLLQAWLAFEKTTARCGKPTLVADL